jgi:hypothetical protein
MSCAIVVSLPSFDKLTMSIHALNRCAWFANAAGKKDTFGLQFPVPSGSGCRTMIA